MSYDLNVMGDPRVRQAAMSVNNTAIEGPQKLVQRMVVLLFTEGDIETNLGVGTDLGDEEGANIADLEVIRNVYNIAMASVKETLFLETPQDAPANERLADVQLQVAEGEKRGSVDVVIDVTTEAGDSVQVSLPVNIIAELNNGN